MGPLAESWYRPIAESVWTLAHASIGHTAVEVLREVSVETHAAREFIDVTDRVQGVVRESGVDDGLCVVSSPHTTAAITINENADPDVVTDLLKAYADVVGDERRFAHAEGNSGAHALTSLVGPSVTLPVAQGRLVLGQWQAVYFCEFDGPRRRTMHVLVIGSAARAE